MSRATNRSTTTDPEKTSAAEASPDELWMEEALRCARRALEADEVPVGAVVICEGRVVGRGWNRNLTDNDPTAHAEVVALREAGRNVGNHRLGDCELFATIEPCAMCAGALIHARIRRLVYGADDAKAGAGALSPASDQSPEPESSDGDPGRGSGRTIGGSAAGVF